MELPINIDTSEIVINFKVENGELIVSARHKDRNLTLDDPFVKRITGVLFREFCINRSTYPNFS